MVEGFPVIQTLYRVCPRCLVGKHPEKSYEVGKENRDASILDLIHSDVSRPMPTTSNMVPGISLLLLMNVQGFAGYFMK